MGNGLILWMRARAKEKGNEISKSIIIFFPCYHHGHEIKYECGTSKSSCKHKIPPRIKKKKRPQGFKAAGSSTVPPGRSRIPFPFFFFLKNPFFVCASANRNARRNEKKGCPFPFSKFPNPYNHSKPPPIITSSTITRKRPLAITFSPCSSWGPWSWRYRGTSWNGSFVACLLSRISISLGPGPVLAIRGPPSQIPG